MQDIHYNELIAQINQDIAKKGALSSLMDFEDVKRLNIYSTAYEESLAEEEIKEMHERREIPVRPEFEGADSMSSFIGAVFSYFLTYRYGYSHAIRAECVEQ